MKAFGAGTRITVPGKTSGCHRATSSSGATGSGAKAQPPATGEIRQRGLGVDPSLGDPTPGFPAIALVVGIALQKFGGEAGAIGSPPAFINALTDALGVRDVPMPATPERVWRAMQEAAQA